MRYNNFINRINILYTKSNSTPFILKTKMTTIKKKDLTILSNSISLLSMVILKLKPILFLCLALLSLCLVIEKDPSVSVNLIIKYGFNYVSLILNLGQNTSKLLFIFFLSKFNIFIYLYF